MYVPCGRCEACRVLNGFRKTDRVNAAFNEYRYRYFVTLTYRTECLPFAVLNDDLHQLESSDCDYNGEVYHVDINSEVVKQSKSFILGMFQKYGALPVLSHSDLIGFKKRLRKRIYEKIGEYPKLFIYAAGEYGGERFRPHYHLCIAFNDIRINRIFRECVFDAWRMYRKYSEKNDLRLIGKTDIQRITTSGCVQYCTAYLNCVYNLPAIYQRCAFRTFSSETPTGDFRILRSGFTDIRKIFNEVPIYETYLSSKDFKPVTTLCSSLYRLRFFPKLSHFREFSHYDRISLYRAFEEASRSGFSAVEFASFHFERKRDQVDFYIYTNFERILDIYFIDLTDRSKSINSLKRLYYVSRRVCQNSYTLGVSVAEYVSKIELFYDKIEQDKLKRFYNYISELQNDFFNPVCIEQIFHLYNQTDFDSLHHLEYYQKQFNSHSASTDANEIYHQHIFAQKVLKIALDNSKTHKRNDAFSNAGRKRRSWIPILSKRKQKALHLL